MKQVLFEEDGAFRVGTILAEAGTSFQVEAAHGKRSKVKAAAVLLRFDGQPLTAFMAEAQKLAEPIDPDFLWEASGGEEFGFDQLANEYFGRKPTPQEATAVALTLHANPMYFYKRGKGRYQAAPSENLKAALAGQEKKRRQQEQVDQWGAELAAGRVPEPIAERLGHAAGDKLSRPRVDLLLLLAPLLDARERGLEVLLGRRLVAALAALVEMDRVGVEQERHGGGFVRRGRAAEVLAREVLEAELLAAAHLPQELRIERLGELLRIGDEAREPLAVEPQEDGGRLHLGALAVRGLDLERGAGVGEDGADAKVAVFLEQDLFQDLAHSTMSGMYSGNDTSAWSPPCTTSCSAPA